MYVNLVLGAAVINRSAVHVLDLLYKKTICHAIGVECQDRSVGVRKGGVPSVKGF